MYICIYIYIWVCIYIYVYIYIYIYNSQQEINFISKSFRQYLYQLHTTLKHILIRINI